MTSTEVDTMDAGSLRAAYVMLMNDYQHLAASYESLVRQQAPAESTTSDRYRAELYDEVWEKARNMGYGNVTNALVELERMKAAPRPEQSVTDNSKALHAALERVAELESLCRQACGAITQLSESLTCPSEGVVTANSRGGYLELANAIDAALAKHGERRP